MEKATLILYVLGALSVLLSFVAIPKEDKRFSSGYRDDFAPAIALFFLGLFLVALGYAVQKAREFAYVEPFYVSVIDAGLLAIASIIFIWRSIRSSFEKRKEAHRKLELDNEQLRNEIEAQEQKNARIEQRAREEREEQQRLESETRKIEARRNALWEQYGDDEIVEKILGRRIWIGMTEDQLNKSRGKPDDISTKESIRTSIEIWKYHQIRTNAYALKITLKDGIVEQIVDNT